MRFRSFAEMIGHYAEKTPDAAALLYEDGGAARSVSYACFAGAVERRAEELRRTGKTCLGVFADGSYACVTEIFAAVSAGLQVVMLDPGVPLPFLRGMLPYTDVDLLWGGEELCRALSDDLTKGVRAGAGQVLFFTSGTTERSKAVTLTEKSLCASAYNGAMLLPLRAEDTLLCVLPLSHVFGFVCGLLWGLSCGACVALGRGKRMYIEDCAFFHPTAVSVVPAQLGELLRHGVFNRELALVLAGAAGCPLPVLEETRKRGVRVSFGYGLTETSSGIALSLGDDPYAMTVCPDAEVSIAEDGEILVKSRPCMMKGYYKWPEETNTALAGGLLHTGDLGRMDAQGRLYITGRKKDMLVLSDGTKVFLPEAEGELARLLGSDLALLLRGEQVALTVYGEERDDAAVFAAIEPYQRTRPRGQQVRLIERRNEPVPRTAAGKVRRWEMELS